jgi:hypothetical protein
MTFINNTFKTSTRQMTPDQAVDSIRDIAKGIRETSAKIRETIKTLHRSGAIDEFTQAVHEATLATYNATKTKEINETSKDLKERGIINDRANAMEETIMITRGTLGKERNTTYEMAEAAPKSRERLQKGSEPVKQKMRKRTSKIKAKRRE